MTTQELIEQYVTAHADNRWMDASELEALLTEFAEKLKEPASEDLEKKEMDESDDKLYAIHLEKWNITGECPSELEAKIDAKFGITGRDSNGNPSNGYCDWKEDVFTNGASIYSFVKLGMDYQKEQMMKDAIDATVTSIREYREENEVDFTIMLDKGNVPYVSEEDVKLIIIKE